MVPGPFLIAWYFWSRMKPHFDAKFAEKYCNKALANHLRPFMYTRILVGKLHNSLSNTCRTKHKINVCRKTDNKPVDFLIFG